MSTPNGYPTQGPVDVHLILVRGDTRFQLTHRLAWPAAPEWARFFEQAAVARREKRQLVIEDRSAPVGLALWDARCADVGGYLSGGKPLGELPDWRGRVPPAHKLKALEKLAEIEPEAVPPGQEGFEVAGEGPVRFSARCGDTVHRLSHRLRRPDGAQLRQYESARALRRITSGGEAVGAGWLVAAVALYDALAVEITGYDTDDATRVPALHKKAALDTALGARDGFEDPADAPGGEAWEKN